MNVMIANILNRPPSDDEANIQICSIFSRPRSADVNQRFRLCWLHFHNSNILINLNILVLGLNEHFFLLEYFFFSVEILTTKFQWKGSKMDDIFEWVVCFSGPFWPRPDLDDCADKPTDGEDPKQHETWGCRFCCCWTPGDTQMADANQKTAKKTRKIVTHFRVGQTFTSVTIQWHSIEFFDRIFF